MSLRDVHVQTTKSLIKSTGFQLFLKRGIGQTTMIDIADHAGIGRRTLYTYYHDKFTLVKDIYEENLKFILTSIELELQKQSKQMDFSVSLLSDALLHSIITLFENKTNLLFADLQFQIYFSCQNSFSTGHPTVFSELKSLISSQFSEYSSENLFLSFKLFYSYTCQKAVDCRTNISFHECIEELNYLAKLLSASPLC
jgi:AcrR family transcriptional regulator